RNGPKIGLIGPSSRSSRFEHQTRQRQSPLSVPSRVLENRHFGDQPMFSFNTLPDSQDELSRPYDAVGYQLVTLLARQVEDVAEDVIVVFADFGGDGADRAG